MTAEKFLAVIMMELPREKHVIETVLQLTHQEPVNMILNHRL